MSEPLLPRIVQLTPPGRGAIATLLIEGRGAAELVESVFRPAGGRPLRSYPFDQIVFGSFQFGSHPEEELVVCRRSGRCVELHCHGGQAAVTRIREAFVQQGCAVVSWRDGLPEPRQDPIAAAARTALAEARTQRTAAILLDQYHGALRRSAEGIRQSLEGGDAAGAEASLRALLGRVEIGRHLGEPWRVVLAGPPNVGKSSLINALVGYERAIVHPVAGTTRDVVSAATAIEGWPLELSDTAGLREGEHMLERAGIELAERQLAAADLVLLVFDSSRPWSDADQALTESQPDALAVRNKCDLGECSDRPPGSNLAVSALTGEGLEDLVAEIAHRLVPEPPPRGAAVPFTTSQIGHVRAAAAAAAQGDLGSAVAAIDCLLGST